LCSFFFSSRRRHTRFKCDWSSDVCSSDLGRHAISTDRQGVIDVIRGSTHADTFTVAARGGYLWDLGAVRMGPIGGLSYSNVQIEIGRASCRERGWTVGETLVW